MKTLLNIAALAAGTLLAAHAAHAQSIPIDTARVVRPILGDTNNYRAGLGLPALVQSAPLMQAAQQYAEYQARTNTTGHSADGRTVEQRILATNAYRPCFYAENVFESGSLPNVAVPPTVVTAALQFWKNSAGHDANLRHAKAKHIGVGAAAWTHGGRHYYKVVQVFGDDCGASGPSAGAPPTPSAPPALPIGNAVASNDFNKDGNGDIVWHNASTGEAQIWFMRGASRIGRATITDGVQPIHIGPPWRIVGTRDFNAASEGRNADLLWYNSSTGETQLWFMDGHVRKDRATVVDELGKPILIGPPWSIAASANMDRDAQGQTDIVWHNSASGETQVWIMNRHRIVRRATVLNEQGQAMLVSAPWKLVSANDVDGNGRADLVWHNGVSGETQVWSMLTRRIVARATVLDENGRKLLVGSPWRVAGTNDFDRDGFADLLWHNGATGESQIWLMNAPSAARPAAVKRRVTVDAAGDGGGALVGLPWSIMSQ